MDKLKKTYFKKLIYHLQLIIHIVTDIFKAFLHFE